MKIFDREEFENILASSGAGILYSHRCLCITYSQIRHSKRKGKKMRFLEYIHALFIYTEPNVRFLRGRICELPRLRVLFFFSFLYALVIITKHDSYKKLPPRGYFLNRRYLFLGYARSREPRKTILGVVSKDTLLGFFFPLNLRKGKLNVPQDGRKAPALRLISFAQIIFTHKHLLGRPGVIRSRVLRLRRNSSGTNV